MKRKLNDDNVPEEVISGFDSFGLDPRLLQGVVKQKWSKPTLVQSRAIPLALEGKDILARASTGSGKTGAYVLPILNSILCRKSEPNCPNATSALILVPTRELASQVEGVVSAFTAFCNNEIRQVNLSGKEHHDIQRARLADHPDVLIATPAPVANNVKAGTLSLDNLAQLVIDEADLVLSYGYDDDLRTIAAVVPKGVQTFMMSATLRADVDQLKGLFCRDPVVLELEEEEKDASRVSQYVVRCAEDEKFLLIYALFGLKLLKGKSIVFVGDIDRCYRLKLYLEQFGIKSCVLNSELPVNTRIHVVEEFNKNVYDIIIATDEHEIVGDEQGRATKTADEGDRNQEAEAEGAGGSDGDAEQSQKRRKFDDGQRADLAEDGRAAAMPRQKGTTKRKGPKRDKEYGISRGIDFQNVACVLNFDLPTTPKSYTHRIGRTARAGKTGMALSFVIPKELYRKHKPTTFPSTQYDEEVLAKITKHQGKKGQSVQAYQFDMKRLEGFRYRVGDALKAVTRLAVREARTRELRMELLKSEKLKRYFEENPEDLQHLRHDVELGAVRLQPHLKHVPDYLLPGNTKQAIGGEAGFAAFQKKGDNRIRRARMLNRMKGRGKKMPMRKVNPLKSFKVGSRR